MGLVMLILMPLFMMGMVGYIFPSNSGMSNVPVALVNLDAAQGNASLSTKFVAQLNALNNKTGMMDLSTVGSATDVKSNIQNGQQSAGIIIGSNFTSDLKTGKQADVTLVLDQSNPQTASLIETQLTQAIEQMGTQTATYGLNQTYKTPLNYSLAQVAPYNVQTTGIVPGQTTNYFEFVAPGIMGMVVMMSLMTGLPHAISFEREVGTPRWHARRTGAPDVDTGRKGHRPDNTRYDAGDHRPCAFDRSLWRGRTGEYRAHPGNLAPRRVQPRRLGRSHHLIHEYRGDRYDDHDDANVSHDVPQRRLLPDIADAAVYAGHRAVPSAHLHD